LDCLIVFQWRLQREFSLAAAGLAIQSIARYLFPSVLDAPGWALLGTVPYFAFLKGSRFELV
jgi:hypothetical protein